MAQGFEAAGPGIRAMTAADVPAYAEVIRRSFATVARRFGITPAMWPEYTAFYTDAALAEKLEPGYYPFGYVDDGGLCGFVSLTDRGAGVFELNNLAVLPEHRGRGYGRALVRYCQRTAAMRGAARVDLSILMENAGLQAWYAALGFALTGQTRYEYFTEGFMTWPTPGAAERHT
jgi:ribosomal-protein-alanine N-acetyltransferase